MKTTPESIIRITTPPATETVAYHRSSSLITIYFWLCIFMGLCGLCTVLAEGTDSCQGQDRTNLNLNIWLWLYATNDLGLVLLYFILAWLISCCDETYTNGLQEAAVIPTWLHIIWKLALITIGWVILLRSNLDCLQQVRPLGIITIVLLFFSLGEMYIGCKNRRTTAVQPEE